MTAAHVSPGHTGGDPGLCPGCRALPVALVPAVLCPDTRTHETRKPHTGRTHP